MPMPEAGGRKYYGNDAGTVRKNVPSKKNREVLSW
jgi:hypothetical protein